MLEICTQGVGSRIPNRLQDLERRLVEVEKAVAVASGTRDGALGETERGEDEIGGETDFERWWREKGGIEPTLQGSLDLRVRRWGD